MSMSPGDVGRGDARTSRSPADDRGLGYSKDRPKYSCSSDRSDMRRPAADKTHHSTSESSMRFACPFLKHSPHKYGKHCGLDQGWESIHRLKEHIYRKHIPDHDHDHAHDHSGPSSIKTQLHKLQTKRPENNEERWKSIYRIIFPNVSIPGAYVDDSDTGQASHWDPGDRAAKCSVVEGGRHIPDEPPWKGFRPPAPSVSHCNSGASEVPELSETQSVSRASTGSCLGVPISPGALCSCAEERIPVAKKAPPSGMNGMVPDPCPWHQHQNSIDDFDPPADPPDSTPICDEEWQGRLHRLALWLDDPENLPLEEPPEPGSELPLEGSPLFLFGEGSDGSPECQNRDESLEQPPAQVHRDHCLQASQEQPAVVTPQSPPELPQSKSPDPDVDAISQQAPAEPHPIQKLDEWYDPPGETPTSTDPSTELAPSTPELTESGSVTDTDDSDEDDFNHNDGPKRELQQRLLVERLMRYFYYLMPSWRSPSHPAPLPRLHQVHPEAGAAGPQRLRPPHLQRDGDEEDDDDRPAGKQPRPDEPTKSKATWRVACPFRKRYGCLTRHRACIGPGWTTVHNMRNHLDRCHSLKLACPRCHAEFDSDAEKDSHLLVGCEKTEHAPVRREGVDAATRERIRSAVRKLKTEEEKWKAVYLALFPETNADDVPQPYCEYPGNNDACTQPLIGAPTDLAQEQLLSRIQQGLQERIAEEPKSVEEKIPWFVSIVRDALHGGIGEQQSPIGPDAATPTAGAAATAHDAGHEVAIRSQHGRDIGAARRMQDLGAPIAATGPLGDIPAHLLHVQPNALPWTPAPAPATAHAPANGTGPGQQSLPPFNYGGELMPEMAPESFSLGNLQSPFNYGGELLPGSAPDHVNFNHMQPPVFSGGISNNFLQQRLMAMQMMPPMAAIPVSITDSGYYTLAPPLHASLGKNRLQGAWEAGASAEHPPGPF